MSIKCCATGVRDLERLLRYEKRAWSRRKKAVRAFTAIKMMSLEPAGAARLAAHGATGLVGSARHE